MGPLKSRIVFTGVTHDGPPCRRMRSSGVGLTRDRNGHHRCRLRCDRRSRGRRATRAADYAGPDEMITRSRHRSGKRADHDLGVAVWRPPGRPTDRRPSGRRATDRPSRLVPDCRDQCVSAWAWRPSSSRAKPRCIGVRSHWVRRRFPSRCDRHREQPMRWGCRKTICGRGRLRRPGRGRCCAVPVVKINRADPSGDHTGIPPA